MKYPYESFTKKEELPMLLMMTSVKYIALHWHDRIEFILVLKGGALTYVGQKDYYLKENDLLFINSNEIHGVESTEDNRLLVLQIPLSFIQQYYKNIENVSFHCQSFLHENQENFNKIRSTIIEMMLILKKKEIGYEIKIQSLLLDIIYQLVVNFKIENEQITNLKGKNMERLNRIMDYIQENFMYPLTLQEIADNEQITVPYLSRYFRQHTGHLFSNYLNSLRLEHAVRQLIDTDLTVTQIAMESGFSNLNTFHNLFKEIFHTTPNQYRKRQRTTTRNLLPIEKTGIASYQYKEKEDIQLLVESLQLFEKVNN